MLRSMFTGVAGLRSHQTMMDVVGNNISNVNTTAYKSTRTTFQEALTQVQRGATAAGAAAGGVNPLQLGLGNRVASVDGVFTQGALQPTGRPTDLAIQGQGYFIVQTPEGQHFTRSGAFSFDQTGTLVGPGGERVQGWMGNPPDAGQPLGDVTIADLTGYTEVSIGNDGVITGRTQAGGTVLLGAIGLANFANPAGLTRVGGSLYAVSPNSGDPAVGQAGVDGLGALASGALEMSNVDLAQEFTNLILAQRGFQANARTITSSDELLQELVNIKR